MELIAEVFTLFLMAIALGMDAFSVGLGMGMFKLRFKQIFHIGLIIGFFHVWMPFSGMLIGSFLSTALGEIARYIGGGLLIILGIQMFLSIFQQGENRIIRPVGLGMFVFALSVSLDSFSVGLTLGIFRAKTAVVLVCFGIVAAVMTWIGLLIGRNVKSYLGGYSEAIGGSILFSLGMKLLFPL